MMKQIFHEVIVKTNGPGLYDFTKQTQDFVHKKKLFNGILNLNILCLTHLTQLQSFVLISML